MLCKKYICVCMYDYMRMSLCIFDNYYIGVGVGEGVGEGVREGVRGWYWMSLGYSVIEN